MTDDPKKSQYHFLIFLSHPSSKFWLHLLSNPPRSPTLPRRKSRFSPWFLWSLRVQRFQRVLGWIHWGPHGHEIGGDQLQQFISIVGFHNELRRSLWDLLRSAQIRQMLRCQGRNQKKKTEDFWSTCCKFSKHATEYLQQTSTKHRQNFNHLQISSSSSTFEANLTHHPVI